MSNPLFDKDIDGNTLNLNLESGVSHTDMYECEICKLKFKEVHFNHETKLCLDCYNDTKEMFK